MANMNLNTRPYYDDYDPEKNFHRTLFKPGYAVQARELTQIQTQLQEQIRRFGNHFLKDGSVVFDCAESSNFAMPYVKLEDENSSGADISDATFEAMEGKTVVGDNQGVRALIKKIANGSTTESPNLKTFYIQYLSTGTDNTTTTFAPEEILRVQDSEDTFVVAGDSETPVGFGSLFSVGSGILYANGYFIVNQKQTIILERYSITPTKYVGFVVRETIVNAQDDETLFDPARGSTNVSAPGADRYKLTSEFIAIAPSDTTQEGFYLLFDIEQGVIKRKYTATQYAELNKTLARRTYDESGDYTVRPFSLVVKEHLNTGDNGGRYTEAEGGDAGKLVTAVGAGKAYVKGFEHELFATEYLTTDKAIGSDHELVINNIPITTGYGSYVLVDTVDGVWPIASANTVNLVDDGPSTIGTARVRDIVYIGGGQYQLYLYDITMTGAFADVETITYVAGSASASLVSAPAVLQKSGQSSGVFLAPYENITSVEDASYVYRKVITSISANGGSFTSTLSGEAWAFTSATVTSNKSNDVIVVQESNGTYLGITSATVSGSTLTVNLQTPLGAPTAVTIMALVRKTIAQNAKSLMTGRYVKINTSSHTNGATGPYSLGTPDVLSIDKVWSAASSGVGDTTYPADPSTDSNWTDVTSQFILDNGQRDATYGLAAISPRVAMTSKKLIVEFSYLAHATSSGYYTVNSYPLPIMGEAPTSSQIAWEDIPSFGTSVGVELDLRNCIDFRPTATLTATDSTTIAGASTNPSATVTSFLSGFTHPSAGDEFIGDLTSNLPRIDRIILDAEGTFTVVRGVPAVDPIRPRQPDNAMTLGYVFIAPFPSLSPAMAKEANKPQYACRVTVVDNRRFTMRDIGDIHRRIDRLEYYVSLSLLEQNTVNLLISNNDGDNRFKNGILVDSFIGHNIGNVNDPAYHCSIADGEMRPFFLIDNIDFDYTSGSNVVRKASDASIVVRQLSSAATYTAGATITSSSTATGTIVHVVPVTTTPGYRWVRLYLSGVSGTFGENNTITQGAVTGTITYDNLPTSVLSTDLRPSLVSTASNGTLVTLPYTHKVFAKNPYASKTRNAVSQLLFTYNGNLSLTPAVDVWSDTAYLPELQVNIGGTSDNWQVLADAFGTQWDVWRTTWQGTTVQQSETDEVINGNVATRQTVETTVQRQERVGTGINVTTNQIRTDLGSRVVSTALVPFMRSIIVTFRGERMKPNTRVYAFFDNTNVSDNCRTGSNNFGTPLIVGADGTIVGEFRIPAGIFSVGTKAFTLTDNNISPFNKNINTLATAQYTANGLSVVEQGTVVSTQMPQITFNRQVQTRDLTSTRIIGSSNTPIEVPQEIEESFEPGPLDPLPIMGPPDPIAQTFIISDNNNGILVSKIDAFFKTKSTSAPITLQIREVVNGYPGETIVPYSTVTLHPRDVNTSEDATAPTPFVFSSPVYLKNDVEYCFVMMPSGNDENYEVWVSELGENQIGTSQRIDKQPYAGVLFVSGNNRTWNAIQSEDIKFTIYQCAFDPEVSGTVLLSNADTQFVKLVEITSDFLVGEKIAVVSAGTQVGSGTIKYYNDQTDAAHVSGYTGTLTTNNTAAIKTTQLTGVVTTSAPNTLQGSGTLFTTETAVGQTLVNASGDVIGVVQSITNNTELVVTATFTLSLTNNTAFATKTARISEVEEKSVCAISPTIGHLDFNNTAVSWDYKLFDTLGVDGTFTPLNVDGTTELNAEKSVFSSTVSTNSFQIRGALSTTVENLSPVVDLAKVGCIIVANQINNDATNETGNSGAALSKYISRRVVLSDGQESEDLRVYLTTQMPAGASIKVYAKLLNDTDPTKFEDRPWLLMDETPPLNPVGYREYTYTLPAGNGSTAAGSLTGDGYVYSNIYSGFKTFAIKIVPLSSSVTAVPRIRDMRALALLM